MITDDEDRDGERSFGEYSRLGGNISGFTAITCGVLIGIGVFALPRLELFALPIFRTYQIPPNSVTRLGQNLCWTRLGEKARNPPLTDIDITVDYISERTGKLAHQPTPGLFFEATGEDFTTDDVSEVGPFWKRVCIKLSARIRPTQPVQVRQIAYFGSITTLYSVPVSLPTIVFPAGAGSVFAVHDHAPSPDAVAGPPPTPNRKPAHQRNDIDVTPMLQDIQSLKGITDPDLAARVEARVPQELHDRLDEWMAQNHVFNRSAAVRQLLDEALDAEDKAAAEPFEPEGR
jgi:hypothetical protein